MDPLKRELYKMEAMNLVLRQYYDTVVGIYAELKTKGVSVEELTEEEVDQLQFYCRKFRNQEESCRAQILKLKRMAVLN